MKNPQCICGQEFGTLAQMHIHYPDCTFLKMLFIGDIIRVANKINRTPTCAEYQRWYYAGLPSFTTLQKHGVFERWNEAVEYTRLPKRRK